MTDKASSGTDSRKYDRLMPCPFCGGEAEVRRLDLDAIEEGLQLYGVWCIDDLHAEGHRTGETHGHYIDNYASEAEAIAAWNARAERTCRDANTRFDAWTCSVCKCTLLLMFDDYGEPALSVDGVASVPNHCPNCGRKVVE